MRRAVTAPMGATVGSVAVEAGQSVSSADIVVVLETADARIPVLAGSAGTVIEVRVVVGETVADGDSLVIVED